MTIKMTESVTNSQYKEFDPNHTFPDGHENKPVVRVTYNDAMRYAAWLSQQTGRKFRLPTEEEREAAEETFEADYTHHPLEECPDVGTFGANEDGVTGLRGTVLDWCLHPDDMEQARGAWKAKAVPSVEDLIRRKKEEIAEIQAALVVLQQYGISNG